MDSGKNRGVYWSCIIEQRSHDYLEYALLFAPGVIFVVPLINSFGRTLCRSLFIYPGIDRVTCRAFDTIDHDVHSQVLGAGPVDLYCVQLAKGLDEMLDV